MARLQPTLSLGAVVLFGIAYMTPIIVLGTFGILAQSTAGMVPAAYLAALVAMFFTAMSYGRMASAFPVAGSAYSYVRKAISPKLGFIAGWAVLLDYLFLPMAIWLIGAAIACYSFLGFDAVSTLTEETRDPRRTIPRAIMLITLIGGLVFVGVSYFVQIAHPSFQFDSVDSAAYEIARNIGGDLFVSIFLIGLIVGQFASGLSAQASGSRLLYAMGRDGVLPKSFFGTLHERFGTPINSILLCAAVALLALKLDVTTSTSFINFGAFLAFSLVNLSVIFHYWIGGEKKGPREFVLFLLFPFIGLAADVWLMVSLDHLAVYLGLSWLAIGVVYLAVLTGGFRRQPPEMDFQEAL
jgi:putrescine importer